MTGKEIKLVKQSFYKEKQPSPSLPDEFYQTLKGDLKKKNKIKLKLQLPYGPEIPLPDIYPKKTII